ncbi:putative ATPase [Tetragenococcus halophilus subsp. halophilus]|uniref:AAA family ATPase n=1 Tax=Tetragenococcus halophilus TaxID=51669 RepID=UPI00077C3147|nr:MoxR family ATPase [Tetragenococcus halophilus]RQD31112.1 MoxR family ATPase [Tetragenococcus halophilus subsp. halophilus DSM 20339]GBD59293.1 putative ATPase [Tetragenococcus halophilus subsp. halophilus]GBD72795.1 putative ATPase [Tetragenococcus halophilus subsp. halophilus]GBD75851.1 putative ATPase [Tetragenococcus halophilus subsp. halophilus]GBD79511.1 putative ATPase [Tetragenococcus halophilus subsp. halophilus]
MQEEITGKIPRLIDEVEKVIFGKRESIRLTIAALLAGGHVLFEDVPGVGKTMMIKTLAKAISGTFSRVQFTPDLLPSDITGVTIFNSQTNQFEFRQGPIFTTILLADEINRTTPRSQAALLEAMSERAVTIDNHTHLLSSHFFVLATQNPIEFEGTYPLPEAQLDRFLFRLSIGYPSFDDELNLMLKPQQEEVEINQVITSEEVEELKNIVAQVYVDKQVAKYGLELITASRNHPEIVLGISPRGSSAFIQGARAYALTQGRTYVTPEDLQNILPATFGHRLRLEGGYYDEQRLNSVMEQLIEEVPVPIRQVRR